MGVGPLALVLALTCACAGERVQTPAPAATVRDALTQLARGEGDFTRLTVTFDDRAFLGGLQLSVRGDGTIQQQAVRTRVGEPKERVAQDDLKTLVVLLVKHEAWTQRVRERQAVPDESRATLTTCYGDQCIEIWEWANDLDQNARIGDVLKFMQRVVWK